MDKYPVKKYPEVGACGLNCNLCPRYHMESASKCPGCCGPGFWQKHPSCSLITCTVKQKGLETCVLCHEFDSGARIARVLFQPVSAPRSCTRDEGRPLGAGLQEQAPNHLKLLWSNARVVSVKEKAL